jgi:integrase
MSTPSVNPKNWESGGLALLKKNWQIQYYFYPKCGSKPKLVVVKGMNNLKTLADRRLVVKGLIDDEINQNMIGYNPIIKKVVHEAEVHAALHSQLQFITAFRAASIKIQCTEKHRKEMERCLNRLETHIVKLGIQDVVIEKLTRSQLRQLMDACELPSSYYNKYLSFLSSIYSELIQYECCPYNIVRDLKKRTVTKKQREILNPKDHIAVMEYLQSNYYEFWRYARIFLFSGARSTELFRLQVKDVNIEEQEYKVTIMKGSQPKEVIKVIMGEIVPLWEEVLKGAKPNDYLFSKGLVSGEKPVQSYQITKRWSRLVKHSNEIKYEDGSVVKITADFYSLKHSFLDSLPENIAMLVASHTNSKTTSIYRVSKEKNAREELKGLKIDTAHFRS